jgi:hypothetical protein
LYIIAGVLDLINSEAQVMAFLQKHLKITYLKKKLSKELIERFEEKFPDSKQLLSC